MIFQLSVLVVLFIVLYFYLTRNFGYWKKKNVKGPTPIPVFGNMKSVAFRNKHMGMFYNEIYKKYSGEKVVGIYRMSSPTLLIRDLDIVKQVMIKDFEAFSERGTYFSKEGLGENIFHSDANTWKHLRPKFTSSFTFSKLKGTFNIIADKADILADYVQNLAIKNPEQDTYKIVMKYAVATALVSIFGMDVDTFKESRIFEIFDEVLNNSLNNEMDMLVPGILTKLNLSILSEEGIKFANQLAQIGLKMRSAMGDTLTVMDILKSMKKEADIESDDDKTCDDSKLKITDNLLAAQVWLFFIAGYANNTLALTYALYHLANNIDIQEKLCTEIDEVLAEYNGKLTYEVFKKMKYLDRVFQETLRITPMTNGLTRSAMKDIKLDGTDLTIDKGVTVAISPYAIQHDEKYYPEPERFDPERFLPENVMNRHPCAFLTFGVGRRSCFGTPLAKIQFGLCLIKLLPRFRVETSDNTIKRIKYAPWRLLLTPQESIRLNFFVK